MNQTASDIAQAITTAHQAAFADFPPQPAPSLTLAQQQDPVYAGAVAACSQLGFIAIDADCIASAWAAQSQRTGQFDATAWPSDAADFGLLTCGHNANAFATCLSSAAERSNHWP